MANVEKGEIAKYQYNDLKYSFVLHDAGEQKVLTSDPWSFLDSFLLKKLNKARGANRDKLERAYYFAGLAEEFYQSGESINSRVKGTLLYYGMLNLVKCYLVLNDVALESKFEHHGLMLPLGSETTIQVKPLMTDAINIFAEFSTLLGKPYTYPVEVKFQQALSHIPEIHGMFSSLGYIKKSKFLPVSIDILVNQERTKLFTEIFYQKEQEAKVNIAGLHKGSRKKYFINGYPKEGCIVYRSKKRKPYTVNNIDRIYKNILSDYQRFDLVWVLTRQGYRYYMDLKPGNFHFLSNSLISMFYLGTAARYRPLEMKKVMEGQLRPLITELMSLTPKQFQYSLVSLITNKECVIPFSAL